MTEIHTNGSAYSKIRQFPDLISNNLAYIESEEDYERKDYFISKEKALAAILPGYAVLPDTYHDIFVAPLEELFTNR